MHVLVARKHTIVIDCHELGFCPKSLELSVQEEESSKVKMTVSTVPLEITDEQVSQCFTKYGTISRVVQLKYDHTHILRTYSGKRLIVFNNVTEVLPKSVSIFGHSCHMVGQTTQRSCHRCESQDHLISDCPHMLQVTLLKCKSHTLSTLHLLVVL